MRHAGYGAGRRSQENNLSIVASPQVDAISFGRERSLSNSDATPTPRPTPSPYNNHLPVEQDNPQSPLCDTNSYNRRHGFHQLLPPRSSSRAESHMNLDPSSSKAIHTSPSKPTTGRTYDSKLVHREMNRLALVPAISSTGSATSLALPAPSIASSTSMSSASGDNPWGSLHVHVLPLFNGEPLRIPIEDLNILVKKHIQAVVSLSPPKALPTLQNDASELIASGMVTLNAKLVGVDDDKLLSRVVEIWGFFWDQVLPYVEGVFLPLHTSTLLSSLYRNPKVHRSSSPTRSNNAAGSNYHIDVRTVALRSFRDRIILPLFPRLYERLSMPNRQDNFPETSGYQQPRLQQMLLVLASQSKQRPLSFSLSAPAPQPTTGEAAVSDLLRAIRSPPKGHRPGAAPNTMQLAHAPTFLSGGLPRDRRGRIASRKETEMSLVQDDTPRNEQFLEALKSPDTVMGDRTNERGSIGGWGLGAGIVEDLSKALEEEEEESYEWEDAIAAIDRMGGKADPPPDNKRRVT